MPHNSRHDEAIDRLACSYLLLRTLYWTLIQTAATHFSRLVDVDDPADLVAAIQTATAKEPDPEALERDGPILEVLRSVGNLEDVTSPLQLLELTRWGVASLVSTYRLEEQAESEAALRAYADEQGYDDDPPMRFTAWLRGEGEQEDEDEGEDEDQDDEVEGPSDDEHDEV